MKQKRMILALCLAMMGMLLCSCSGGYTSNENCVYCGWEPTKKFQTINGTDCYVCKECSTTCFFCGDRASENYTNGFDEVMFVCDACYADIVGE